MSKTGRVVGTLFLLVFVGIIVLRPLLSNPAIITTLDDGFGGWPTLLFLPLVVLAVVLAVLRVRTLVADDGTATQNSEWTARNDSDGWSTDRDSWDRSADRDSGDWSTDSDAGEMSANDASEETSPDSEPGDTSAETDTGNRSADGRPDFLAGQGGTRDRDFEIEEEPPESGLDLHLEHLREGLGEDESLAAELDTLEEVVEEEEEADPIPGRCPQEYCDALWTEPGVLGFGSGKYEVLDNGRQVQCLECEQIVTLE